MRITGVMGNTVGILLGGPQKGRAMQSMPKTFSSWPFASQAASSHNLYNYLGYKAFPALPSRPHPVALLAHRHPSGAIGGGAVDSTLAPPITRRGPRGVSLSAGGSTARRREKRASQRLGGPFPSIRFGAVKRPHPNDARRELAGSSPGYKKLTSPHHAGVRSLQTRRPPCIRERPAPPLPNLTCRSDGNQVGGWAPPEGAELERPRVAA